MKLFPSLAALVTLTAFIPLAQAQSVTPGGDRSDQIMRKIRTVDDMIQIVPLAMTKEQIRAILPAIEKARAKEIQIRKLEDSDIAPLDAKLDTAIKGALAKGEYPPRDLQQEVYKLLRALSIRRQFALNEMVDTVYEACDKTLNAGQKKVMEKSLDAAKLDPSLKPDQMKPEEKIKFFIRQIFLDEPAYDILVKMSV